jgi:hypothetical protein
MVEIERMTMEVLITTTINEGKSDNETHIAVVVVVVVVVVVINDDEDYDNDFEGSAVCCDECTVLPVTGYLYIRNGGTKYVPYQGGVH